MAPPITLREYAADWLVRHRASVKAVTIARYRFNLERYVFPVLQNVPLADLRPAMIRHALDATLARGLSTATWSAARIALSALLADAVLHDVIEMNPAHGLRIRRRAVRAKLAYRPAQLDLFLATATRDRPDVAPLYATCALTGLRIGEALALRAEDVDVGARALHVVRGLDGGLPKGNRGSVIPLTRRALAILAPLAARRHGWLFPGRFGAPRSYSSAHRIAVGIAVGAGLEPNGTHVLRRSFAVAQAALVSSDTLRVLLRHRSLQTTDLYVRDLVPIARPAHYDTD